MGIFDPILPENEPILPDSFFLVFFWYNTSRKRNERSTECEGKEEIALRELLKWIANRAYRYGEAYAGMASIYGMHEPPVPEELKKSEDCES